MSFNVTLYKQNKKVNSTKRPYNGTNHPCIAKSDLNVMNPIISLNMGLSSSPVNFNYAYIEIFDRYYFIDSWTFSEALWHAKLSIDVLASWKDTIGGSSQYIVRSSSNYNLSIPDSTYPLTNDTVAFREDAPQSPWTTNNLSDGMYVVGIVGESTTYYIFTQELLSGFLNYLFSDEYVEQLVGGWIDVFPQIKAETNPLQYISSIQWFPYMVTATQVTNIRVGFVNVTVPIAWRIDHNGLIDKTHEFTLAIHPQANRGKYLKSSPYSTYTLFYPPWGTIHLDSDVLANSTKITCHWTLDLRTGRGTLRVYGGAEHEYLMSWVHSQVSVNFQVSQVVNSGFSLASLVSPITSLATGNYIGAIGGTVGAIGNAVSGKVPSATTIGSNGGLNALVGMPSINYEFKTIVDEDLSNRGRPLCELRTINSLSGFILVSDSHISISGATKNEQDMINSFMEGGFYYE